MDSGWPLSWFLGLLLTGGLARVPVQVLMKGKTDSYRNFTVSVSFAKENFGDETCLFSCVWN